MLYYLIYPKPNPIPNLNPTANPILITDHNSNHNAQQETQLSLTNGVTHWCRCNGLTDLLKTRPSPYVLPSRIWSFCGVGINIGVAQNCWALEHCSLGMGGLADTKICAAPSCVLPRQLGSSYCWQTRTTAQSFCVPNKIIKSDK